MKSVLKKNQIMITALALMIAVAGYLNFAGKQVGNEELVTTSAGVADAEEDFMLYDLSDEDLGADIESLEADPVEVENYLDSNMETAEDADALSAQLVETVEANSSSVSESAALEGTDLEEENTGLLEEEVPGEAVFTSSSSVATLSGAKLLKEQTRAKNKETLLEIINNANIADSQKQDAINGMISLTDIAEKEAAAEILLEAKGFSEVVVSMNGDGVDVVVGEASLTDTQRAQIEDIVKRKTGVDASNIIISPINVQE